MIFSGPRHRISRFLNGLAMSHEIGVRFFSCKVSFMTKMARKSEIALSVIEIR